MTTQSIRNGFGMTLASTLVSDIQYLKANYYYYLGKISPWASVLNEGPAPDLSSELSQADDNLIRSNMMFAKKIGASEVSLVVDRNDWTYGHIYPRWDDTANMIGAQFYVMTSSVPPRIYKCIDNNGGTPSLNEPSTSNYDVIKTADGYVWKYMYSIPPFKVSKFASPTQMPVQRAISDSFYNNGSISDIIVNKGGTGYVPASTDPLLGATIITVTDTGHTAGSGAAAHIETVSAAGAITSITVSAGGSGYIALRGAKASITNTGIRGGAVLVPVISGGGAITSVDFSGGAGLGYQAGDTIDISVGGASLLPILDANGSIVNVKIMDPGIGYTSAPSLTVTGVGSSAYSSGPAILEAVLSETATSPPLSLPRGSIVNVLIKDPGINYTAGITLTTITGDGTGATCSPIISEAGVITGIVLNNRGSGYTYANVIFPRLDETGTGAVFTVNISQQDYTSDQANVEQTAVAGAIYATEIIAGGNDYYQEHTTVTITGDGTGAVATATITPNNITGSGTVTGITMVNYGSGYTNATITVSDSSTSSSNAVIRVIYTPPNGHGFDAAAELYARTVAISTVLSATDELNTINQDYRQYGILRNPNNYNSSIFSSADSDLMCYQMFLEVSVGDAGFIVDETVTYGNNNEYPYVVANSASYTLNGVNGTTVWLIPQFGKFVVPIGAIKRGTNNLTTTHAIKTPTINKYSGQLLLASNENHFTFTNTQSFAIKSYIKL